ncbi:ABC transporter ATP-binding protein [Gelatiniphilus marinus]|uniref:ABC transporter ATP-binding protein n=1 Tax=Gelatiniphilus marinus TaxID=1759464 RepID=A0ABW5JTQ0_9FLAO
MTDNQIILKVDNISKQYRLGLIGTGTISHDLNRWWSKIRGKGDPYLKVGDINDRKVKSESDYVWALRNIDFEVTKGEVLGIIGKNGAGKSTLLKILSKVTGPTQGEIKTKGRIASLLEVGTGFHPEMTGLENIFLNGAILGMTKKEIKSKIDEIIDFSGCQKYIDTPVKRYSSGMRVRLAFAVAAHLEPDILVIDEVLAVGDAEFQKKAIGKMQDISKGEGRTILFVSHDMAAVKSLCTRGILLENGQISFEGTIEDTVEYYLKESYNKNSNTGLIEFPENNKSTQIKSLEILRTDKSKTSVFLMGEPIVFKINVRNKAVLNRIKASVVITSANGVKVTALRSHEMTQHYFSKDTDFSISVKLKDVNLMPNSYFVTLALLENNYDIEVIQQCTSFSVIANDIYKTGKIPKGKFLTFSRAEWSFE